MRSGTANYYYHYDGLGDVANLTGSSGAKQWTYAYEPYGALRTENKDSRSAPANLMRFTGEYSDSATNLSTGLYYLRARTYDPVTGRFLQLDPVRAPTSVPYVSPYVYVRDLPTVAVDPLGLWCLIHNSSGGCLGGSVVRWAWDNRFTIGTLVAAGCAIATLMTCALVVSGVTFGLKAMEEIHQCGMGTERSSTWGWTR